MVNITAGRLKNFTERWKNITTDDNVLECLKGYKIPFREVPYQHNLSGEPRWSESELIRIKKEIDLLLLKNAIEERIDSEGQFVSPYFLVSKPNGSSRLIK